MGTTSRNFTESGTPDLLIFSVSAMLCSTAFCLAIRAFCASISFRDEVGASSDIPARPETPPGPISYRLGRRTEPVPSTVVTTSPFNETTGRRQELIALCTALLVSVSQCDRITVHPPQPP